MSDEALQKAAELSAWLASLREEVLEPDIVIVDPHHHLWVRNGVPYLLRELLDDMDSGHNVVATVFAECHSMYRAHGPEALRAVGETEFVSGIAAMAESGTFGPSRPCTVMFGGADLSVGAEVEALLEAHLQASGGRFRGIRYSSGWHESEKIRNVAPREAMLRDAKVRDALRVVAGMGLSFDTWVYHPQLLEVAEVADDHPGMTIILNHVGSPILGGPYRGRRDEVFEQWRQLIPQVAERENIVMKLGALPIRLPGSDGDRSKPPGSQEVADVWRPWLDTCIEAFGPSRCMFESNFPVQRAWCSYQVVWNAFKRLAAGASEQEKSDLFAGTAQRAYRIESLPG